MKLIRPLAKNTSPDEPRSAQVRERRQVSSQARVHAAAHHATSPVTRRSVPVTPGFMAQPVMKRTQSKARRKFSIALSSDGAQLVLPALPIVRPGWQTFSAILVVIFLAAIIFISSSDTFRVDTLTVNGVQRLQPADLMAISGVSGDPIFAINPDEMTKKLNRAFPELSSIQISVSLPNQVTLDVTERQPVFEWKNGDTIYWIDLEGAVFKQRGVATLAVTVVANVPPPMVPVAGAPVEETLDEKDNPSNQSQNAASMSLMSEATLYDPALHRVDHDVLMAAASLTLKKPVDSVLVYHKEEGFGWQDPRGWDVYFGQNLDDLDLKFEMYQAIINQLAQQAIEPVFISVAHVHAPFYRARQTGDAGQ